MRNAYGNIVLVTGASSGIGKAIAESLSNQGLRVYGTSRKSKTTGNKERPEQSGSQGFLEIIQLDVCSEESVKNAINYVMEREGTIDILINNAGIGIAGSVEDTTTEEAYYQFDTNFFGVHRMCRNVLPVMRRNGHGLIINIGSVAGLLSIPFQSMYSASKYALEAMSEALRIEAGPYGIKVTVVEPGDTSTGFTDSRKFIAAANENSIYRERFEKSVNVMIKDERNGPGPEKAVKLVNRLIGMKNPPVRKAVGFSYKLIAQLRKVVPSRCIQFVISKLYS